jgi:hypothetical protein
MMGWTKRDLILQAFEDIGIASYDFDLSAEQLRSALRKLDTMVAGWIARNVRLPYPLPASPSDSDLDEQSGVPDIHVTAVTSNLAVLLAPGYGKTVSIELKIAARNGLSNLFSDAAMPDEMQMPGDMPAGAGNGYSRPFLNPPTESSSPVRGLDDYFF